MKISWKASLIGLITQGLYFVALWYMPDGRPGSQTDLLSGRLAAILFVFYLVPAGLIALPLRPLIGDTPISETLQFIIIGLAALFYALIIGLVFGFFGRTRKVR